MPRAKKTNGEQPSKAQRIRDEIAKSKGKKVRPRDIIAALAADGVKVSSAQVSLVLRSAGYRRKRRGKKVAARATASASSADGLNIEGLLAAKALVVKLGSVEAAEEALKLLKKLG